jgi:hypothetical protein
MSNNVAEYHALGEVLERPPENATLLPQEEHIVVLFLILLKSEVNGLPPEVIE